MGKIPASISSKIRRYTPVDIDGVRLYPVIVDEYEAFSQARPAIEFAQQSLPVAYVSVPLLQAYYAIDINSLVDAHLPSGLLARAMIFLALALRVGRGEPIESRIRHFKVKASPQDVTRLISLAVNLDGEELYEITPVKFQRWLPILAAQNGLVLPSDTDNPELLRTEGILISKQNVDVDISIEAVVSSVATLSGMDESAIYDWPILKLDNRRQALQRTLDYVICGIGETQGTKWKHGNPVPSPFFPKKKGGSIAAIPMDEFAGGAARDAIQRAQQ